MDRRSFVKGAAVAIPAAAVLGAAEKTEAATITNSNESSILFDNCSYLDTKTLPASGETQIMASAYMSLAAPSAQDTDDSVVIQGAVYVIPGKGCEGIYLRMRRGYGLGGAIDYEIGNNGLAVVPGKLNVIPVAGIMDTTAYRPGPGQYTVTLQQNGATAAGQIVYGSIAFTYVQFNH